MGSYVNLARRAVETEMPIMVKVIKDFLFFVSHWDLICLMSIWIGDLEFEVVFLCFQMQELLRGAKNAVSLAQVCF